MKLKVLKKPSDLYKVAMTVSVIILGFICYIFAAQMESINNSANSIAHGNELQYELERILTAVNTNEIALKNYLLTDKPKYLDEREQTTVLLQTYIQRYRKLGGQDATAVRVSDSLEDLTKRRRQIGQEIVALHNAKPVDGAKLDVKLIGRNNLTLLINSYVKTLLDEENREVKHNNENHRKEIGNMTLNAVILTLTVLAILFFAFKKFYDDVIVLGKVNDELRLLNYSFENAENTAGFGYWKYNVTNGKMIFSGNFFKVMGIDADDHDHNLKSIMKRVHPNDIEMVMEEHHKSIALKLPTNFIFRILLPNGESRYINSVGNFTKNSSGDLVKVGANYDITTSYTNSKRLEKSNKKLRAINEELESFNHIASHDLQEPLRKIQMFVSRIKGSTDVDSIENYHEKIRVTAQRMQQLLTDLLEYSRMVKVEKSIAKVDLNNAANVAIEELSERITETSAEINISELPDVKAISFQMERLFANLIGNAIKYSKETIAPIITIVERDMDIDLIDGKEISGAEFHKIEVSDNGIGFLPEYAERMFILFKRLDNNQKYSGTGVGLAICKKIMENHNGFIRAEGIEGIGAKFFLYFPKPKR